MNVPSVSVSQIHTALDAFKSSLVAEPLRDSVQLSKPYELFEGPHGKADWPDVWGKVWGNFGNHGVYLHFDAVDSLLYVGKAVSLGGRLGNYFGSVKGSAACHIKDPALKDVVRVRAIVLDEEPLKFLVPSLEWYLIDRLSPPVNKQHKKQEWMKFEG